MKNKVKKFVKDYKKIFILLFIMYSIIELINIVIPMFSAKLIDSLISKDFDSSQKVVFFIVAITIFSTIINYIFSINKEKVINNLAYKIEKNAYTSLYNSNYFILKKEDKILISQKILKDSYNISSFILSNIFSVVVNGIVVVAAFYILYTKHVMFFVISLLTLPIYVIFIYFIRNSIHKFMYEAREKRDEYSSLYLENIKNIYGTKAYSIIEKVYERLRISYKKKLNSLLKEYRIFYMFYSVEGVFTLIVQTIFFFLGIEYIKEETLTIGNFTIILTFYQMIIKNFNYYLILGKDYEDYSISIKRLDEIEKKEKDNFTGDFHVLEIKQLEYKGGKYELGNGKHIEYNPFIVKKGEMLKIEGKNGSGKTTLLDILLGIYPSNKTVFINGIDINDLSMSNLRRNNIAYVNQNFEFIEGSVLDNINFYSKNFYSEENIKKVLYANRIDFNEFSLSDVLSKKINNLSEGQKQIIALIIVFIKDADIIILDEPLKGLDRKNKEIVTKYIKELKRNKIILLIEHEDIFCSDFNKLLI